MDARQLANADHAKKALSSRRSSRVENAPSQLRLSERAVLQLQALVGNAAVSRALDCRAAGRDVLQRTVTPEHLEGGEPRIRQSIVDDVRAIMAAVETGYAKPLHENRGPMLTHLERQIGVLGHAAPASANDTYGLSAASYFPNVATMGIEGPASWRTAVSASVVPGAPTPFARAFAQTDAIDVGNRETHLHDEVMHITALPGVQAVAATQQNCIFCYGLLELRGYEHGPLRARPWPDGWTDPGDFQLLAVKDDVDRRARGGPQVLNITTSNWGSKRYHVVDLWARRQ